MPFPPAVGCAIAMVVSFLKKAMCGLTRPATTINSLSAAITALYKPLGLFPMKDPLVG